MKKFFIFSAILIVVAFAGVLVFAQTSKDNATPSEKPQNNQDAVNANVVKIEFFYHGNNNNEKYFVDSQKLKLSQKYASNINIFTSDLNNKNTSYGNLNQNMFAAAKNVVCVLNNKYYLSNIDSIKEKITKYIDFILEPEKHQNPMLYDLLSENTNKEVNADSKSNSNTDNNISNIDKLVCDTYLHDLLKEIDKIYPFSYIAEAEVADVYVDVNFDKKLLNTSKERFENTLSTILSTYNFYFVIENDFYVIKQKPMIVNEAFTLSSRIEFDDFIIQCMKLLQNNETLTTDRKAQVVYFIGSKETYEKIDSFLKAILKTYEYNGK